MATGLRVASQPSPGWADVSAPVTLTPVGDTAAAAGEPDANFGSGVDLRVDNKPRFESYLRFAVPDGLTGRAVLRLFALSPTKNGPEVWRYEGTLDETALTWANAVRPLAGQAVDSGALGSGTWADWDVTDLVAGRSDVTLALAADSRDGVEFAARESGNSPQLVITAADPSTSTTSTSASTSTSSTTMRSGTAPECEPGWGRARTINRMSSGLGEMSGFTASPVYRDWGWGIRDGGHPASLYAIKPSSSGPVRTQERRASGVTNSDWEDVAYTPGFTAGTGHLWVLENVGNGWTGNRWIYQFEEPDPEDPPPSPTTTDPNLPPSPPPVTLVGAYQWAYPDEQANTETMFVFDGDLVVVSKTNPSRVYRFNEPPAPFTVNVPAFVGTLPSGKLLSVAAISTDQRTLAFSNHGKLDVYENRHDAHDLAALISNPVFRQDMSADNREGGSFFPYGSCDLWLVAESKNLWRLDHGG